MLKILLRSSAAAPAIFASLLALPETAWCGGPARSSPASKAPTATSPTADALFEGFKTPPQAARPQVWWHLMNGNVTKEGMDLDLAWMARMGIGGVHAFSGAFLEPTVVAKPLPFMSDGWRAAFRFAVTRARSLGMEVTIAGSPGWHETGGPWVAPSDGMKKYVWSETRIEGGRNLSVQLAVLPQATGLFQAAPGPKQGNAGNLPIAAGTGPVIAFPIISGDDDRSADRYSSEGLPLIGLGDARPDLSQLTNLALNKQGTTVIDVSFPRSRLVRSLTIASDPSLPFEIQASGDGRVFTTVGRFAGAPGEMPAPQQTVVFDPVRATAMRVVLTQPATRSGPAGIAPQATRASLRRLRFGAEPRLSRFEGKAGFQPTLTSDDPQGASPVAGIDPARVIDLTDRVGPDGRLSWRAPPGRWAILRFGWSLTGRVNGPAERQATGLEVDKLDPAAVGRYLEDYLRLYERDTGVPLGKDGISGLLTDSWEAGVQNWTPTILADFRRLRGYDPSPWLPTLSGYVVRDVAASDAFLADFRQTLKDLVVDNHYRVLRDAAHAHGMIYYTEAQGDLPRAIGDGLTIKGQSDIPTAEFWARPFTAGPGQPALQVDLKEASSAAHIYGQSLAAAESFTMGALNDPWSSAPNMLKPVADRIFALGINRILYHDSHHQPLIDKAPGLQLAIFGQWFNRNETWAEQARPWTDYLARSSYLLQQGRFVADIAYLYGEERTLTDIFENQLDTAVPRGFGFDYVDAHTVRDRLVVRDGRVTTPSGMAYRVVYLAPSAERITLPYAQKLLDLVTAGAVLVGMPPKGLLGLSASDATFRAVTDRLWPDGGGADISVGQGRVLRTSDLASALASLKLAPDVMVPTGADLLSLRRCTDDADIFYLSNQGSTPVDGTVRFRVTGRVPQWWSPENGTARALPFSDDGRAISIRLKLLADQAGFVIFRSGQPAGEARQELTIRQASSPIAGPWRVTFEKNRGAPASARFAALHDWSRDDAPGIRYFSGRATYTRTLSVSPGMLKGGRLILDLGDVHELASVRVNGKAVATAWHAPYRVDVTDAVRAGRNWLEIEVANLWVNRLIGDAQPNAVKITYAPQAHYAASTPLRPSGLIGPVVLTHETGTEFAF